MIKNIFVMLIFIVYSHESISQRFSAALVLGINASQIDGDGYAGYHKVGLTGGAKLMYPIGEKADLGLEFLFSQRGSKSSLSDNGIKDFWITLNYAEIPLIISYHDWLIEGEDYYKVSVDGGLSYGRLISSSSSEDEAVSGLDEIKNGDLSYVLGLRFRFNKHWATSLRYTRSLFKMNNNEKFENYGLLGYFLTLRSEYYF